MVAEIYAGLASLKAAFDIAKGLKDIDDATRRNAAVIELQEKILAAHSEQAEQIERIRELEKEVANFEAWDTEKKRYELKHIGRSCFVRMLKPEARGSEPPHLVCANCYEKRQISIIQYGLLRSETRASFFAPLAKQNSAQDAQSPSMESDGSTNARETESLPVTDLDRA